jgi:hypothetical protein
MKKAALLLPIFLVVGLVFATSPARDFKLVVQDYLEAGDNPNVSPTMSQKIQNYRYAINAIQAQIDSLSITNPVNCKKISQTLWEGKTDAQTNGDITSLVNFINRIINNIPCQATAGSACTAIAVQLQNTGVYNSAITQQVKKLQKYWGIYTTGSVGPQTLAKINSMICDNETKPVPPVVCTQQYAPVCAQPPYPKCPDTASCDSQRILPKTYGNSCVAKADGASVLYEGQCKTDTPKPILYPALQYTPTSGLTTQTVVTFSTRYSGQGGIPTIDYGDGTYEQVKTCYAPADACLDTGLNTHIYSKVGEYTARVVKNFCPPTASCFAAETVLQSAQVRVGDNTSVPLACVKMIVGVNECLTTVCDTNIYGYRTVAKVDLMTQKQFTLVHEGACYANER